MLLLKLTYFIGKCLYVKCVIFFFLYMNLFNFTVHFFSGCIDKHIMVEKFFWHGTWLAANIYGN